MNNAAQKLFDWQTNCSLRPQAAKNCYSESAAQRPEFCVLQAPAKYSPRRGNKIKLNWMFLKRDFNYRRTESASADVTSTRTITGCARQTSARSTSPFLRQFTERVTSRDRRLSTPDSQSRHSHPRADQMEKDFSESKRISAIEWYLVDWRYQSNSNLDGRRQLRNQQCC